MDAHADKLREWTTRQAETMHAHADKLREWTPMQTS
jgi:hypothetical protein